MGIGTSSGNKKLIVLPSPHMGKFFTPAIKMLIYVIYDISKNNGGIRLA